MFSFLNPVGNYLREIKEPTKSSDFLVNHAKRPCIHHFANRSEPGTPRISSPSQYLLTVSRIERDKSAFRRDNFKLPPLKRRLHRELIYYFGNDPKFELDRHDRLQKETRMLVGNSKIKVGNSDFKVGNSEIKVGNSDFKVGNSKIKVGNSKNKVGNSDFKVGNSKIKVGNSKFKVGNSKIKVGNSKIKVGNSDFKVGNSKIKVGNSKIKVGNSDFKVGNSDFKVGNSKIKSRKIRK
ncbi:hypothetical protein FSP39_018649 [Pinctada imbricata]|uniref:Uncharacterized protein n=1 Tax=Pinctada imbricata TaxID=66713 RepID=A0AA89C6Z1_PINIB|nr:hypothetical protein FSP39_018649 [Pinctada imbricata]